MGGDGNNIRLIYVEDEQSLVFPQIAKNECAPRANVPHSPLPTLEAALAYCTVYIFYTEHMYRVQNVQSLWGACFWNAIKYHAKVAKQQSWKPRHQANMDPFTKSMQ